jgi:light-regulated signal transduction histidine kinase (bacteriophytochrome)
LQPNNQDLDLCAREPIHIPGAIQPHGALFVIRSTDGVVVQASQNVADYLGETIELGRVPSGEVAAHLEPMSQWFVTDEPFYQAVLTSEQLSLVAHRRGERIVVEVERTEIRPVDEVFGTLRSFTHRLGTQADIPKSLAAAAEFVRQLTQFDRVLVYRFDPDWNGHVVAESNGGRLPVYLDLRFPSGDIPAQARALYSVNRLRIIPNATYVPVPILSVDEPDSAPLDLSLSQLRSVSPVHLEYMRNMGTFASMSVSIIVDGAFWGLIACHSAEPHLISHATREICDFVAQSLAMRISALVRAEDAATRAALAVNTSHLLAAMTSTPDWVDGLLGASEALLAQVHAAGAAVVIDGRVRCIGSVPDEHSVMNIVEWLSKREGESHFATESLSSEMDGVDDIAGVASGVLAVSISKVHNSWLIWFRPELVRTVTWGGNPHKVIRESGRIHPRQSFDAWKELVRRQAAPWLATEEVAAQDLRAAIVGIVLRKAEELAQLSTELQRSNKELEAFSYSVSHDLRAPFRHIVGFAQLLRERETELDPKSQHYLQTISEAALSAGKLVDDLLNFSQLGRASVTKKPVDMNKLVAEVVKSVRLSALDRNIEWSIAKLPDAWGDATLIRQVWFNLIDNAVKYTRPRNPAKITIDGHVMDDIFIYNVRDNGVGFDMAYVGKLFGVFQRLQRAEDFDGTGIGLALARRIIERHNGSIKAVGEIDSGASFTFALPGPERKERALA